MAAPRKYSDAQRQAMFRLFEAGKSPAEIARLCKAGTAGVAPFDPPRRTVQEIVTAMATEAERNLPTSVVEAESAEAVERFPARVAAIFDAEIQRLESKQKRGQLTLADLDLLQKAATISFDLHKRLNRREAEGGRASRSTRQAAGPQRAPESAIEKLAREQRRRDSQEDQPSRAHSRPANEDRGHEEAPVEVTSSAQKSLVERAEAASKARAALAR